MTASPPAVQRVGAGHEVQRTSRDRQIPHQKNSSFRLSRVDCGGDTFPSGTVDEKIDLRDA
eukprot:6355635-Prymnesium_polylepis.1